MSIRITDYLVCLLVGVVSVTSVAEDAPSVADAPEIVHDEEVITVPTQRLLGTQKLSGDGFTIKPNVSIYRTRAFYEGKFAGTGAVVVGTRQILERVNEVNAVHTLRAMRCTA